MMKCCGINTTPPKSGNGWKGTWKMYSICVKFKPELNWRPYCRQFTSLEAAEAAIDEAFKKWEVHHASMFENGVFLRCFWYAPWKVRAAHQWAMSKMQHASINHVW